MSIGCISPTPNPYFYRSIEGDIKITNEDLLLAAILRSTMDWDSGTSKIEAQLFPLKNLENGTYEKWQYLISATEEVFTRLIHMSQNDTNNEEQL